ncbi:MAG: hypothetical protein AB7T49_02255 [Oligoflexales bacterium]
MRLRFAVLALFVVNGCSKSEFSSGKSPPPSEKTDKATSGDATGENPKSADREGASDRELQDLVLTNSRVATPGKLGEVKAEITVKYMRSGDADLSGSLTEHTVDFLNVTSLEVKKEPNSEFPDLVDQTLTIVFEYKYVPEVTRYEEQIFEIGFKQEDGEEWDETIHYAITILTPESKPGAEATATFSGVEGHPKAQPAG